ncbi:MAG: hypothetical protein GC203_04535 [Phenylobacterium sp.]|uniref:M10 family metallopeptidase C-terminal domain-containing protein n=1 Tax=Phenylobacterium sp. TaxID=1871053 RepID=UPI0025F27AAD|nr:M10 family metallopeptidase C-terminal domain-containing protein [Phenylobacterium sp.]MBI1197111.1 hypothetical protein [Phenylobacterium sp.]
MGSITIQQVYDGLWAEDHNRWSGAGISYSIPGPGAVWSSSSYGPTDEPYDPAYGVLSADQASVFDLAVGLWARLISVNVSRVADTTLSYGNIRVAVTDTSAHLDDGDDAAAYAYYPPAPGSGIDAINGDIWIDTGLSDYDPSPGGYYFETLLHELGHAFGLKHPFEGATLPSEFDNTRYTVMSYTDFADSSFRYFEVQNGQLTALTFIVQPATPMPLDIIAIRGVYGAAQVSTSDDAYGFDENYPLIATVVDDGGVDTFNFSDHSSGSLIDLTPGAFSSISIWSVADQIAYWTARFPEYDPKFIADFLNQPDTYTWRDNLATSADTTIENVIAGAGDDTIQGNDVGNKLSGGEGDDRIFGKAGADTIEGGAGTNYLRGDEGDDSIVGGSGFDDINGNMGNDTCASGGGDDWVVGGKDNDSLTGSAGQNLVYGNLGNDTCDGGDGDDIVRGGQNDDVIFGGAGDDFVSGDKGDDTITGGAGADRFHTFGAAGIDRVLDFHIAEGDRVQLDPGTVYTVSQVGADTVIDMTGGGKMILVGVQMSTLTGDWIFGA